MCFGIGPICKEIGIAPSAYHGNETRKPSARDIRDKGLMVEIGRVYDENRRAYGARRIYRQLLREEKKAARRTVERLMRTLGTAGERRDSLKVTAKQDESLNRPTDLVKRDSTATAPDRLWAAGLTYVATWPGFVYAAFIIDAFSKMIVGWNVGRRMTTGLVLPALECALWARCPDGGLISHNDAGSQHLSIACTGRLAEAGIQASVGSVGDACDNALAETVNGLFKAEVVRKRAPWKNFEDVGYATLDWVEWSNNRRLMGPIGGIPPKEFEALYYEEHGVKAHAA